MSLKLLVVFCALSSVYCQSASDYLQSVRNCFGSNETVLCLKETVADVLNDTVYSNQPLNVGVFEITRDVNYHSPIEISPAGSTQRSLILTDVIYQKVEEFFNSRIIKFKLGDADEARKKGGGGGGKKGGGAMLMMGGIAMAGMMAQMFMGKLAFLAGTALLLAKMALILSTISAFKKSSNDGGGKDTAHVVYASSSDSYGHGGGWHRSLNKEDVQQNAYSAYSPTTGSYK